MAKVTEPEVVFCEYNHIYDKSLNATCPYCKQIAEKTNQMKSQLSGSEQKDNSRFWRRQKRESDSMTTLLTRRLGFNNRHDEDDDATVLARSVQDNDDDATVLVPQSLGNEDDDATELVVPCGDNTEEPVLPVVAWEPEEAFIPLPEVQEVPVQEEDKTPELIAVVQVEDDAAEEAADMQSEAAEPAIEETTEVPEAEQAEEPVTEEIPVVELRRVIGWLVCIRGQHGYGTSLELKEGDNMIAFQADGMLTCNTDAEAEGEFLINRDPETGFFQIHQALGKTVTVNGGSLCGTSGLMPYSKIELCGTCVVFFPAVGVCGFEWRQQ